MFSPLRNFTDYKKIHPSLHGSTQWNFPISLIIHKRSWDFGSGRLFYMLTPIILVLVNVSIMVGLSLWSSWTSLILSNCRSIDVAAPPLTGCTSSMLATSWKNLFMLASLQTDVIYTSLYAYTHKTCRWKWLFRRSKRCSRLEKKIEIML